MEQIPSEIGQYQIYREVGRGGMAVVYAALDTRNGREVALKVLLPQHATDATFLHRFIKEGKATESLHHDNIVRTYEAGHADGYYYIAMQLIGGGTLLEYVQNKKRLLTPDEIISILSQIAAGLDYAHSRGFLHRDLKLSNILMTSHGAALLSDFGVVKLIHQDNTMQTMAGFTVGTPAFMAPEQARGEEVTPYADVYSLGVIAYTLFTGRMPFTADNQAVLMYKIVHETAPAPDTINSDIPSGLIPALNRVIAKEPAKRYASAGEFIAALISGRRLARMVEFAPVKVNHDPTPPSVRKTFTPPLRERNPGLQLAPLLGWGINIVLVVGLLWYVLAPVLHLNRQVITLPGGEVASIHPLNTERMTSQLQQLPRYLEDIDAQDALSWWQSNQGKLAEIDLAQTGTTLQGWLQKNWKVSTTRFSKSFQTLSVWVEDAWGCVTKGTCG